MRGVIMYGPGDVRVEDRADPAVEEPTDAVIRLAATCICGSDLWPYRGVEEVQDSPMGHEYIGVVEEIGADVRTVKPGDFVVGSFWAPSLTSTSRSPIQWTGNGLPDCRWCLLIQPPASRGCRAMPPFLRSAEGLCPAPGRRGK